METKIVPQFGKMPFQMPYLMLGLLILLLTFFLVATTSTPIFASLLIDERCETVVAQSSELFSAETAVPDCWLVP